jgi:hypothetical protein
MEDAIIHAGIDLHSRNMTLVATSDIGNLLAEENRTNIPADLERFNESKNKAYELFTVGEV